MEDHLQGAAGLAGGGGFGEVFAFEPDAAAGGGEQAHDGAGEGGFAAAGLADEAEDLAAGKGKVDAVHGFHGAGGFFEDESALDREVGAQVAKFENGRHEEGV